MIKKHTDIKQSFSERDLIQQDLTGQVTEHVTAHAGAGQIQNPRFPRRHLLKLLAASLISSLATAGYVRRVEPYWLDITQIDIAIPNLAPHLVGKRLAQLSDIHLSNFVSPDQLAAAVEELNRIGPDWVALTGDYVSRNAHDSTGLIDPLRKLDAPTYAVWGNHDLWTSIPTVQSSIAETPVIALRNQGLRLDTGLWLAGVDTVWGGSPNLRTALSGAKEDDATILMVHEPDYFDRVLAWDAPVALQISGHSHGGQVRLPRLTPSEAGLRSWAPVLPRYGVRYPIGHRTIRGRHIYTNRGLGLWPVRMRFNCRPELTIFALHQA